MWGRLVTTSSTRMQTPCQGSFLLLTPKSPNLKILTTNWEKMHEYGSFNKSCLHRHQYDASTVEMTPGDLWNEIHSMPQYNTVSAFFLIIMPIKIQKLHVFLFPVLEIFLGISIASSSVKDGSYLHCRRGKLPGEKYKHWDKYTRSESLLCVLASLYLQRSKTSKHIKDLNIVPNKQCLVGMISSQNWRGFYIWSFNKQWIHLKQKQPGSSNGADSDFHKMQSTQNKNEQLTCAAADANIMSNFWEHIIFWRHRTNDPAMVRIT